MLSPVLVTPPVGMPVSLAEAKAHLRVRHNDQDGMINDLVRSATAYLDGWAGILGRALVTQTWRARFDGFPDPFVLPLAPVQSVTMTYFDAANVSQTVAGEVYRLSGRQLFLDHGFSWPAIADRREAVSVDFVAGYGAPRMVPAPIRQAIQLLVERDYDGNDKVQRAIDSLVAPYRIGAV